MEAGAAVPDRERAPIDLRRRPRAGLGSYLEGWLGARPAAVFAAPRSRSCDRHTGIAIHAGAGDPYWDHFRASAGAPSYAAELGRVHERRGPGCEFGRSA